MKILIVGANGFLAQSLIKKLKLNNELLCLTTKKNTPYRHIDYQNLIEFKELVSNFNPELIFYFPVATLSNPDYQTLINSFERDKNFFSILDELSGNVRVFFFSSMAVFPPGKKDVQFQDENPSTNYALEKNNFLKLAESYETNNISIIVIYASSIYGPNCKNRMFIPSLIASIENQTKMLASGSSKERDFIYVEDVTDALIKMKAVDFPKKINKFFFCSNVYFSLIQISKMICNILDIKLDHAIQFNDTDVNNDLQTVAEPHRKNKFFTPTTPIEEGLKDTLKFNFPDIHK